MHLLHRSCMYFTYLTSIISRLLTFFSISIFKIIRLHYYIVFVDLSHWFVVSLPRMLLSAGWGSQAEALGDRAQTAWGPEREHRQGLCVHAPAGGGDARHQRWGSITKGRKRTGYLKLFHLELYKKAFVSNLNKIVGCILYAMFLMLQMWTWHYSNYTLLLRRPYFWISQLMDWFTGIILNKLVPLWWGV